MKSTGKFLIGFGIAIWVFMIFGLMAMGSFSFVIFLIITGCSFAFIISGATTINKANEAEEAEKRFREIEEEHSRYKASHSEPAFTANSKASTPVSQHNNSEEDWFKD